MTVRIYKPAKSAMQSGYANSDEWVLEHEPDAPRRPDPLMGWVGSGDTRAQVKLTFATREAAIDYAMRNGLPYRVHEPKPRGVVRKSYGDNFKFGRLGTWTH